MKSSINLALHDNPIRLSIVLSFGIIMLFLAVFIYIYSKLPPYVPLFNSMPWGQMRVVSSGVMLYLPAVLVCTTLLNLTLVVYLYKRYTLIARILAFNSFLFAMLTLFAFVEIIFLIF